MNVILCLYVNIGSNHLNCMKTEEESTFSRQGKWSNLMSSIPADTVVQGRPYGGTGFICKPVQHCTFHNVPQEDDRISVIEIRNNNRVVITLIGVYLPDFHSVSTPLYGETLDKLDGIIQNITFPLPPPPPHSSCLEI